MPLPRRKPRYERKISERAIKAQKRFGMLSSPQLMEYAETLLNEVGRATLAYQRETNLKTRIDWLHEAHGSAEILVEALAEVTRRKVDAESSSSAAP